MAAATGLKPDDRYVLTLGGVVCGEVIATEGGEISAPVIREPDASGFVRKHLGSPAPNPIQLALDLGLQPFVYRWIDAFWTGRGSAEDGTLTPVDPNLRAKGDLAFEDATIAATSFPTADASTKDAGKLAITLLPARTSFQPDPGKVTPHLGPKQRPWLASNFRLQIDGLDCTRVVKAQAGSITHAEGAIDVPDLKVTLTETGPSLETWSTWLETFVAEGNNDATQEKSGTLSLLAPDLKAVLATVKLSGLGIYRLAPEQTGDTRPGGTGRFVAELYCQRIELDVQP
jgi:hypothetical protein